MVVSLPFLGQVWDNLTDKLVMRDLQTLMESMM